MTARTIGPNFVVAVIVALVVVTAQGVLGITGVDYNESIEKSIEQAKAYCYQTYGDARINNAMVIGNHGGWHCAGNEADPHYHEVTLEARQAALEANESDLTFEEAASQYEDFRRYTPPASRPTVLGFSRRTLMILGALMLLIFLGVNIAVWWNSRGDEP